MNASLLRQDGKVLRLEQVIQLGLSLEEPGHSYDSTVAMSVTGFLVIFRIQKNLHPSGSTTDIRSQCDRSLEIVEKRGVGF